jgi:succinoglycan biosynthesis protein ExoA
VYLGSWPRQTFERFGGFDETLVRNQDDEHNLRIHKGGGRIWQSASIQSTYFPRASKMDVFRQYRQYGYWKPFVMRKHGQAAALRHLVPGLFVGALIALSLMMLVGLVWMAFAPGLGALNITDPSWSRVAALGFLSPLWFASALTLVGAGGLLLLALLYGGAVLAVSVAIARQQGPGLLRHLPDVIAAYHLGYGLGSLRGWWDALVRRRPDPAFGRLTR